MKQEVNPKFLLARKTFLVFLAFLILCLGLVAFLFSPFGNVYIRDFLLSHLESQTHFKWEAKSFKITPSHLSLEATAHNGQLELFLESDYSLFLRNLKGKFLLNSKGFSTKIANKTLYFSDNSWIEGEFSGEFAHYKLQAQSNLLDSQSDLISYWSYLELQGLNLHTKNASLAALFALFHQAPYGDGILSLELKLDKTRDTLSSSSIFQNIGGEDLKNNLYNGTINVNLEGGELEAKEFLSHFDLAIPPTRFMGELQGEIQHNTLKHYLKMHSSVGDFTLKGTSNLITLATNTEFHLNFQNLSPFSPFFGIPLGGALSTNGIAKGDIKNMLISGAMTLEQSPLDFRLNLQNLKVNTFKITSQNLEASALFALFNQPAFLHGVLNLDLDLRDFASGISGIVSMQSQNLLINSPLIEMHTFIGFPAIVFQMESKVELAQGKGIINYSLISNSADLKSQEGKISLQPLTFEIPQEITLKKLQNFSYRNKSLLKGTLNAQGVATNESLNLKGEIVANEDSKHQGDSFSFALSKTGLNLQLNHLSDTQFYTIFPKIPHYFKGITNLNFKENFADKTRQINLDILNARFQNTALLRNLNQATQRNLAHNTWNGFIRNQLFSDNQLHSAVFLQSKNDTKNPKSQNLKIQSPKIVTNLNKMNLEGNLLIQHHQNTKKLRLYGNIYQPKIH